MPTRQHRSAKSSNSTSGAGASYSRFSIHYYYFSRSDSIGAPSPQAATRWLGNQKLKNRVNVRFMAKVFWSVLSKIRNLNPNGERVESKQTGRICQFIRCEQQKRGGRSKTSAGRVKATESKSTFHFPFLILNW